jgi:predicted esterase
MRYSEMYRILKGVFSLAADHIDLSEGMGCIVNRWHSSHGQNLLPGAPNYWCRQHDIEFPGETAAELPETPLVGLSVADAAFTGNSTFRYSIFKPAGIRKAKGCIILLHGLNERSWEKYLPWAARLAESTCRAVVLMPIAFHMNRAPEEWSLLRPMRIVSKQRKIDYPQVTESSFANAAISTRFQQLPQRLFWSGIQTYTDVLQLVHAIKRNEDPDIEKDARIDFFGYSIGAFLAEILCMANEKGIFSASKLVLFCGGPTLDRMHPVSKYILDSEALTSLLSFFQERLESQCCRDPRLRHYFGNEHPEGLCFKAMLSCGEMKDFREERFKKLADRTIGIALRKDEVIQPVDVIHTLQGEERCIPIQVHTLDFGYPYSHMNPFPIRQNSEQEVDEGFDQAFELASRHFSS